MDTDYILVEGDLSRIKSFVVQMENHYAIKITKYPATCLTMIKAEDSLEKQPFFLGEALTTETEVVINDKIGIGICIGDEPQRAYCIAVIDSIIQQNDHLLPKVMEFLEEEAKQIKQQELEEQHQILRSQVDFKLMDQD